MAALIVFSLVPVSSTGAPSNGYVAGTVTDSIFMGNPVKGATVTVVNTTNSGTTDASGKFNLSLPPGNYTLKVTATGFKDATSSTLKVTSNNTTSANFYLEKPTGTLTGTVTDADDGTPQSYVSVVPEGYLIGAMTDAQGQYTITKMTIGYYKLTITPLPPYSPKEMTVQIKADQTTTLNVQLAANTTVMLLVKNHNSKPVAGAVVSLGVYSGTTDSNGTVTFPCKPGTYMMNITAAGYKPFSQNNIAITKGDLNAYEAKIVPLPVDGGGGGSPMLLIAVAAVVIIAVVGGVVGFMFMKKRKATAPSGQYPPGGAYPQGGAPGGYQSGGAYPQGGAPGGYPPGQGYPPPQKSQEEKMNEWREYEKMYNRPHPEAPGWVSGGPQSTVNPRCPMCKTSVQFEPYSGGYYCSKCNERYRAEQVLPDKMQP